MEHSFYTNTQILFWLGFLFLIWLFRILCRLAKKRKGVAFAAGLLFQMFLPDPKVQHTIEFIVEKKEKSGEAQPDKKPKIEDD